jgi:hypothetical protein
MKADQYQVISREPGYRDVGSGLEIKSEKKVIPEKQVPFLKRSNCRLDGVPVIEKISFLNKDTPISSEHSVTQTQRDDKQPCSVLFKAMWALAHLFMLQAIILHATAKHTFAARRTRSLPIP